MYFIPHVSSGWVALLLMLVQVSVSSGQNPVGSPDGFNRVSNPGFEWVETSLPFFTSEGKDFARAVPKWETPNQGSTDLVGPSFKGRPGTAREVVRTGEYAVGLSINTTRWGEYISAPLLLPLEPGQWYYAEAWVKVGVSARFGEQAQPLNPYFGFHFGEELQSESTWMLEALPQVALDSAVMVSSASWTPVSGFFRLEESATWLTFGQFVGAGRAGYILSGYFYVDDLKVVEAAPFPEEWEELTPHTLNELRFNFDSAELLPASRPQLGELLQFLSYHPELTCRIVGYADQVGSPEYNLGLSNRRAQAVANYLIERGIDPQRLIVEGRGEASTDREGAEARRVVFEPILPLPENR